MQKIFTLQDIAYERQCSVDAVLVLGAAGCNVACIKSCMIKCLFTPSLSPAAPHHGTSPGLTPHIGNMEQHCTLRYTTRGRGGVIAADIRAVVCTI